MSDLTTFIGAIVAAVGTIIGSVYVAIRKLNPEVDAINASVTLDVTQAAKTLLDERTELSNEYRDQLAELRAEMISMQGRVAKLETDLEAERKVTAQLRRELTSYKRRTAALEKALADEGVDPATVPDIEGHPV